MLTVFRYSASYTVMIVLWKMLLEPVNVFDCWRPCACLKCVSGLRKLEKTLNFLRCIHVFDLVLKYALDINDGNWLQLLFYFTVLMGVVASVIGMSSFSCVAGFRLKLSRIALWWKRFHLDSRSDLVTNGSVSGFFVQKRLFFDFITVWTESCKKCSIIILLWRHQFSLCLGWGVLRSVL